ncbi:unnamed protein product [Cyclocybe aegerita]|uniref:MFS general substrate transporter n=1 Tax=Cyclocybe aegerita TaxID=1973307 RepID=A0A8S0WP32_CYCAE|nr:unnamed protein product [Cyclocybe aegerita]
MISASSSTSTATQTVAGPSSASSTASSNESAPLLQKADGRQSSSGSGRRRRKPFYRARPLWLVPFAVTAALVRGMTLAPRVGVLTQLACTRLHGRGDWNHTQHAPSPSNSLQLSSLSDSYPDFDSGALSISARTTLLAALDPVGPVIYASTFFPDPISLSNDTTLRPLQVPTQPPPTNCAADPAVQAGAARLQTLMSTTMGLLSALTTGWWGHFGERHGRTRVLAIATFGLVITDLTFILLSKDLAHPSVTPVILLLAPAVEGALGGWSTLQSATSAYLSDCTSPGSRAGIFSRFTGVLYLGFAVGPSLGGWLLRQPFTLFGSASQGTNVTSVFYVAALWSLVNFLLVLLVFPESLSQERRARAMLIYTRHDRKGKNRTLTVSEGAAGLDDVDVEVAGVRRVVVGEEDEPITQGQEQEQDQRDERKGLLSQFLGPLAAFLPVLVLDSSGLGRKKRDWSLTLLAAALFGFMLSMGVYQIKYLYATHTFDWGPEQLSYYISFMGGARALFLLFILPTVIGFFKPRPISNPIANTQKGSKNVNVPATGKGVSIKSKGKKPKPTRAQLGQEIAFDLTLTRCSLMIDIASHTLVALLPAPGYKSHVSVAGHGHGGHGMSFGQAEAAFVVASSLNSMGSGAVPAIQSLALCVMQVRAMDERRARGEGEDSETEGSVKEEGTGPLFGALAVLQAIGQMILGPMLFGLVYSGTVARFPKAIFVTAAAILMCALLLLLAVRNPVRPVYPGRRNGKGKRRESRDVERGRSRVSKDLRGGAVGYGATSEGS